MFSYEQVKSLNYLEMIVYHYVIKNQKLVQKMTIRELSEKSHVSTTTILRFCNKMGCEGYSELKYKLRELMDEEDNELFHIDYQSSVISFFKKLTESSFENALDKATKMICKADRVIFLGIGTSGILGEYGKRFFSNMGIHSSSINDPYFPIPSHGLDNQLVIALSVSGETRDVMKQVVALKNAGATVLGITNAGNSSLAKIADLNISYYMPDERAKRFGIEINLTTQIPVLGIIEILAHRAEKLKEENGDKL